MRVRITTRDVVVAVVVAGATLGLVAYAQEKPAAILKSTVFDWNSWPVRNTDVGQSRQVVRQPTTHARRAGNARHDAERWARVASAAQAHERGAAHLEGGHAGSAGRWAVEEGRARLDSVPGVEQLPRREERRHDARHLSHRELELARETEDERTRGELHTVAWSLSGSGSGIRGPGSGIRWSFVLVGGTRPRRMTGTLPRKETTRMTRTVLALLLAWHRIGGA